MPKCKLYPDFSIYLQPGLQADYRKIGKRYEKRCLLVLRDGSGQGDWSECGQANYALALLRAHEQAEAE